jgi:tRNA U34 5-methylaminomethyl-2-thiouridine-forming methyltransferase MnmC
MKLEQVKTKDNSTTFCNTLIDETYHSTSGAKEEAIEKYARPCGIGDREEVSLLDVCFGLGYNSAAALDMFKGKRIEIIGLENDEEILDAISSIDYPFNSKEIIIKLTKAKEYTSERVRAQLIVGDARESVKNLSSDMFDVVFFDPFSPKKCPELWTGELFSDVYRIMKKGGVLATYSCAGIVRRNMKEAGFSVSDGPCVGRKSPGTIGIKAT